MLLILTYERNVPKASSMSEIEVSYCVIIGHSKNVIKYCAKKLPLTSILAVVRPYRQNVYNITDVVLFLTVIQICFSSVGFSLSTFDRRCENFVTIMTGTGLIIPQIYAIVQLLKYIIPSRLHATNLKCLKMSISQIKVKVNNYKD